MQVTDEINLGRIADALERLSPPPRRTILTGARAYVWSAEGFRPVQRMNAMRVDTFAAIDDQRDAFLENVRRHGAGLPAHDTLLWGARGMGKSALVRAAAAHIALPLVQVEANRLTDLPDIFRQLSVVPRRFLVFIDDLGIDDYAAARVLRSILDGGLDARPDNCCLAVTANRRHLVRRKLASDDDRQDVNPRDRVDDELALSERFGLSLGFHACSQEDYLSICEKLAAEAGVTISAAEAVRFATERGARSGRVAHHYITDVSGRTA
ncbi:DUF815 domain-containing protein [Pacificimonas sp. WHA3]|uniref:DUF815 domain-containing protein n=1 Tax=Pacificimonas pallii TaxID=2827236 RepID=A0ABS6SEB4_9SPHN|nr:DUF815 domain-containing protein [Pacificimonas pallii]MBV7256753.1 DUF815 domain-containing protein [Pacificimonas pallii]